MSRLKEVFNRIKPKKIRAEVDPQEEMISIVVDTTHEEGEERVDLGNLGTFKHQPDGNVVFTSDNPRVKGTHVGRLHRKGGN
jgi:hypothetical protein